MIATRLPDFFAGGFKHLNLILINVIGRVTLQAADFHRVAFAIEHDACAFAKDRGRANPRATCAENIRAENRPR